MAPARHLRRHHRRNHHLPAASRCGGHARSRRRDAHQDDDLRCRLQRLRQRDSLADRHRLLAFGRLHQVWPGQPCGVHHRVAVRQDHAGSHLLPRLCGGAAVARDPLRGRARRRHLLPAGQGAVRRVRLQPGGRHPEEDGRLPDEDLLPVLHHLVCHVHHRHGRQSSGCQPGCRRRGQHHLGRLGAGCHCAGPVLPHRHAPHSVCSLPSGSQGHPRCADQGEAGAGQAGPTVAG
mmetsp:Transcript_45620/g.116727  ORF Transcript_45620/g.116727 Transcript_45620/m.116727 type:complete len:234 (+) Transcript_45620:459-1160(+)